VAILSKNLKSLPEVQELIKKGKEKGFLTYEELNDSLPQDFTSVEDIDDMLNIMDEMDIEIREEGKIEKILSGKNAEKASEEVDFLDAEGFSSDPVQMYLHEMGKVPLLERREDEVRIAKKIETAEINMKNSIFDTKVGFDELEKLNDDLKSGTVRIIDIIKTKLEGDIPPSVEERLKVRFDRYMRSAEKSEKEMEKARVRLAKKSIKPKAKEAYLKVLDRHRKKKRDYLHMLKLNNEQINLIAKKIINMVAKINKDEKELLAIEKRFMMKGDEIKQLVKNRRELKAVIKSAR